MVEVLFISLSMIFQVYDARNALAFMKSHCFFFSIGHAGLQWALHTSQHQNTSGSAKTLPPGYCLDATTHGWCVTTVRRCPSILRPTCGVLEYCWTMTLDLCLSTMLSALSTCTHLTSPLLSQSALCSTCGTGV